MLRIRYAVELPETPLHFNFRYKGDSVGRYRRYGRTWNCT